MSPEQVKGGELDARTDLFSLGIVVFTMLVGKKPFTGNTAAVMFKIVYEEPPAVSALNPELTPAHDYLVKRCLAKDINRRYSSARELLDDLDDLQHGRAARSQAAVSARLPAASPAPTRPPTLTTPPPARTVAMPSPGQMEPAAQQPSPQPWRPPATPLEAGGPAKIPSTGWAPPAQAPRLRDAATLPPTPRPFSAPPAQPPKAVTPPPAASAPSVNAPPLTGQTLQMQAPDLSAVMPAFPAPPPALPVPPAPAASPLLERTRTVQSPSLSGAPPEVEPVPANLAPPLRSDTALAGEPVGAPGAVLPAPKSKVVPIALGAVAVVLLGAAILGYWGYRRASSVAPPPVQVAVQTPQAPETLPPVTAPAESPTPPPAATEQTPPPVSPAPEVVKKTAVHKPKQSTAQQPASPEPPPVTQPEPAVVTPPPQPTTPSPEDIAKAEAARLANIPRVVQVVCNYGLKEATFVFSSGGKTLFEETLKGKKVKGGFLGIKGSYQGSFSHTITVPAGVSEVSVRVLARDGATDLTKAVKMPLPGGFVPTLAVEVDSDHLSLNWKGSAAK